MAGWHWGLPSQEALKSGPGLWRAALRLRDLSSQDRLITRPARQGLDHRLGWPRGVGAAWPGHPWGRPGAASTPLSAPLSAEGLCGLVTPPGRPWSGGSRGRPCPAEPCSPFLSSRPPLSPQRASCRGAGGGKQAAPASWCAWSAVASPAWPGGGSLCGQAGDPTAGSALWGLVNYLPPDPGLESHFSESTW